MNFVRQHLVSSNNYSRGRPRLQSVGSSHGQNLIKNETLREVTKGNFLGPLLNWAKKIKENREYKVFEKHLLNISIIFERYGFVKELDKIKEIMSFNKDWKFKLDKIKKVLG